MGKVLPAVFCIFAWPSYQKVCTELFLQTGPSVMLQYVIPLRPFSGRRQQSQPDVCSPLKDHLTVTLLCFRNICNESWVDVPRRNENSCEVQVTNQNSYSFSQSQLFRSRWTLCAKSCSVVLWLFTSVVVQWTGNERVQSIIVGQIHHAFVKLGNCHWQLLTWGN